MIKSASEIRSAARMALSGHWAEAAMFTFVYYLASWAIGAVSAGLDLIVPGASMLVILLVLPMGWGYSVAFLGNRRGAEDPFNISHLLDGYKDFAVSSPPFCSCSCIHSFGPCCSLSPASSRAFPIL